MKRVAEKHEAVVRIPMVVRIAVVVVEPALAVIAIHVEQSAIPVRVVMYGKSSVPLPFEYSLGCIVFGITMP